MRLRDILGPHARRETVWRIVRPRDRIVQIVEVPSRHDRAKDLLACHASARGRVLEESRPHEVPILQICGIDPTAPREQLRAFLDSVLDRPDHVRGMVPGDERADLHVVLQGGPEPQSLRLLFELREERRGNRLVDEELRSGPAHLARVLEGPPEGSLDGPVQPRVREDDLGILATELECRGHDPVRDRVEDLFPGVRGTREGHRVDVRMRRQGAADVTTRARDDIHDSGRKAGGARKLSQLERRERGQCGRLQDDGVAGGERRRNASGSEEERIVPGGDVGRHAERVAQGVIEPRTRDRDGVALNFIC